MSTTPDMNGRSGLTLIEVVISAAIVAGLSTIVLAATVPLSNASTDTAIALDMDRIAQKVLGEVRRDLRQTGYLDGAARFTLVDPDADGDFDRIVLKRRTGPAATDWSADDITWQRDAATSRIQRVDGTLARDVGGHASDLTFAVAAGDQVCEVTLKLSRTNDRGTTITRAYVDRIEMMNR